MVEGDEREKTDAAVAEWKRCPNIQREGKGGKDERINSVKFALGYKINKESSYYGTF
jgi:hypothetical protein